MSIFKKNNTSEVLTFWEHLEVLRWTILRILLVVFILLVVIFSNREFVFDKIIFPPINSNFITYRGMCWLGELLHMPSLCPDVFELKLINYDISGQFMVHISSSITLALVLSMPYILYEIWRFVAPALYTNERKHTGLIFLSSSVLFYLGCVVAYLIIFPLSIRFLGTYEVSSLIPNNISLQSYMSTLYILVFALGIMFELPILAFLLSRMGIISRQMLRSGRRFALVIILIIAAIITPTTDPFTMLVVALPIYLLYELSILVCAKGD
jgi:sec-independent protein translocase protein TatC